MSFRGHNRRGRYFDSGRGGQNYGAYGRRQDQRYNNYEEDSWRNNYGDNQNADGGRGFTPTQRYGISSSVKERYGRNHYDAPRQASSDTASGSKEFVPLAGGGAYREDRQGSQKERPPPGLKGKEIGLWYAKRSQARKEREQKVNRSTVSIDKNRERNIRELLSNLQEGERDRPTFSTSNSSVSSTVRPGMEISERNRWKQEREATFTASAASASQWDHTGAAASSSSSTTFMYQSPSHTHSQGGTKGMKKEVKEETPDTWEVLADEDVDMVQEGDTITVETVAAQKDEVIDLDGYDEDGNQLPSVAGVVQYMMSHGDYPFAGSEPESDFVSTLPESDNPKLDQEMTQHMQQLSDKPQFVKMLEFRKKLPSYNTKEAVISAVNSSQALVISGETGCGKTTQVPQFILDSYIEQGVGSQCRIICTQPRRISAISVAERVAAERCDTVDNTSRSSVGYQIRLETKRPRSQGSILFCTTGIVLKFLESDPSLYRATHVIIDEIHERDLQSDFLMIILKDLLPQRPDLKVILMSATLNAEMFSKYFNNCPMLNIPGYTFPVKQYLLEDVIEMTGYSPVESMNKFSRKPRYRRKVEDREEEENYQVWCRNLVGDYSSRTINVLQNFDYMQIDIELIHHIINHICTRMEDGAILVFVPGWEEIKKLHDLIQGTARCKSGGLRVIPLHSLMPTVNQREVFDRPPPGVRKIVIATNIAETSITIDDVVFVIDCGKIKVKGFQPEMNLTSLEAQWVSKANAKQRRGRAGRVQPGYCFHLITKFRYDQAQDYLPPEMLRTRLEELCLQIKLLKLGRIIPFIRKAMQHPSVEAVTHAVETLIELNALDRDENLLPLGYHLARMPVEPHTGKMILFGAMFCCLDPILTVAASLSFKDAFTIPLGKEDLADKARGRLSMASKSDHIMLINALKGWEQSLKRGNNRSYCWENFLSENTLKMLRDMKKQLAELLHDTGFVASKNPKDPEANRNSENLGLIRAVLCAGLYPNVAQIIKVPTPKSARHKGIAMLIKDGGRVHAHPKSVNMRETFFESKWLVFYHKLKTTKVYVHDSSMVSPYPLLFFGGEINIMQEEGTELVCVDDWIRFKAAASTAQLVKDLRKQLDKLLSNKITHPGPTSWDKSCTEGAIMAAIADLITMEDIGYSVRGPSMGGSIGKRF